MNELKLLSRSEMRMIKGGNDTIGCPENFISCGCAGSGDQIIGSVCCSEDIDAKLCCQLQYPATSYAECR